MAKNKKSAAAKKEKSSGQPEQGKAKQKSVGPKAKDSRSGAKRASNFSQAAKQSKSCSLTFWLLVVVCSTSVGLTGVFFSQEIQTTAEYIFEDYVHPQVLAVQEAMRGDEVDGKGSNPNIPSDSAHSNEKRSVDDGEMKEEEIRMAEKKAEEEREAKKEEERKEVERKKQEKEEEKKREEEEKKKREEEEKKKQEAEKKKREEEEKKKREEEEKKKQEAEKKKQEAEKKKREEEETKKLEEEEKKKRVEEEKKKRVEEEKKREEAEKKKREEEEKKKREEEKKKREEEERKKREEEEKKKREEEETKKQEEEEKKKQEEEKKEQERIAAEKKAGEERKKVEEARKKDEEKQKADKERKAKQKAVEEKKAAEKKAEEEKKAAEAKKEEERIEAERKVAEKKAAEERKAAEKKAEEEKRELDRKAAEEAKKAEEERQAVEKKLQEERKEKNKRKEEIQKAAEEMRKEARRMSSMVKEEEERQAEGDKKTGVDAAEKEKEDRASYKFASITNDADFKIREDLDEADALLAKEDIEAAVDKYDSILRRSSQSPRAHYGKALTLDKLGFRYHSNDYLEHTIEFLVRVLAMKNVPDELMKMAGRKLADRQQFRGWGAKAAGTYKFLTEKFPDDLELHKEHGVSHLMVGQNEKSREVFSKILKLHPESGFAKAHLGFILKTVDNKLEEAITLLSQGIASEEEGTQDGRFYMHLGDSLIRLGQEEKARVVYRRGAEKGLFLSQWQRSLYNVDRLTGRPWWTPQQTGYKRYLQLLQDNWKVIRDEGMAQLDATVGAFVAEDENLRDTGDWKQLTLFQQGRRNKANCEKTPKTCSIIEQIPDAKGCKRGQVKFSVMSPGIHVWPHVGPTNCRLRAHLGLVVPEGPRIRVVEETRTWKEGEFIIFDDSFEHEVWHNGSEWRLVLIVDFWHPEITDKEKKTLSAI